MAVSSPIKALLTAHMQVSWNRSKKELGKTASFVLWLTFAVLACFVLLPILGGGILLGYFVGVHLAGPHAALGLSGVLVFIALLGGAVGGIFGGSRVLAWESTRVFPLSLRNLFLAELIAGLGDPLPLITATLAAALLLGVGVAQPRTLPFLPLIWAGTVASQLCLQHLAGSLSARLVKRLQVGLILLGIAVCFSTTVITPEKLAAFRYNKTARQAETLHRIEARADQVLVALPPSQALLGLSDAVHGRWGMALGRQVYPVVFLALLLLLAAHVLKRDTDPQRFVVNAKGKGVERLWRFSSPVWGVARLHWHTIISSHLGKFGFLVPLLTIVLINGPLASIKGTHAWSLPAAVAFLALTGTHLQLNQFGLDGSGVKALFLLPLRAQDLLQGKFWGLAMFHGVQVVLLLILLVLYESLTLLNSLAALCLGACLFVVQTSLGHWTSSWMPRPLPRNSLKNTNQSPAVAWIGMAVTSLSTLCFGGVYMMCLWLLPAVLFPVMMLLLGACLLLYRRMVLPACAHYLDRRREFIVQALG